MACACKKNAASSAGKSVTRASAPSNNGARRVIRRELK